MRDFYEIEQDVLDVIKDEPWVEGKDVAARQLTEEGIDRTNERGGSSDFEIPSKYTKNGQAVLINVR